MMLRRVFLGAATAMVAALSATAAQNSGPRPRLRLTGATWRSLSASRRQEKNNPNAGNFFRELPITDLHREERTRRNARGIWQS